MSKRTKITYESEDDNLQQKIKKLKAVLKKIKKERNDYLAGWQRAKADLINSQRRFDQQTKEICDCANFDLIKNLLPVLDSLNQASKTDAGLQKLRKQLMDILADFGLAEIKIKKGDKLDHDLCEVVAAAKSGKRVSQVVQKGYCLNERIIRPIRVKVG